MTTKKDPDKSNKGAVVKPLSKQVQAAVDAGETETQNDGSHIIKQREAILAKAQEKK